MSNFMAEGITGHLKYTNYKAFSPFISKIGHLNYGKKTFNRNLIYTGHYNIYWQVKNYMARTFGHIRYIPAVIGNSGEPVILFDSMCPIFDQNPETPITEEQQAYFATIVKLNGVEIDKNYILSHSLSYGINQPFIWSLTLDNSDTDIGDIISIDSIISFHIKIFFGQATIGPYNFKNLIIKGRSGDAILTISGTDETSHKLYHKKTMETFCWSEALTPLASSKKETENEEEGIGPTITYTKYQSFSLTNHPTKYGSILYINAVQRKRGNYSKGDTVTLIATDSNLVVLVKKPLSAHWIIKRICDEIGVGVSIHFEDFEIRTNVPVQNIEPIFVIEKILSAVPGEWIIDPENGILHLYDIELDSEKKIGTDFYIHQENLRDKPQISENNQDLFNTINVCVPAEIEEAYKSKIVEVEA